MKEKNQMLFAQLISVTGGLFAGIMLASATGVLEKVPGILILLPAFLEMRGNISGTLAARLGTALHLGAMRGKGDRAITRSNLKAVSIMTIILSLVLGFASWAICSAIGLESSLTQILLISVCAAVFSNAILVTFTIIATKRVFKMGYDPDNIMGPLVTTIGDIVSVFSLVITSLVFINV